MKKKLKNLLIWVYRKKWDFWKQHQSHNIIPEGFPLSWALIQSAEEFGSEICLSNSGTSCRLESIPNHEAAWDPLSRLHSQPRNTTVSKTSASNLPCLTSPALLKWEKKNPRKTKNTYSSSRSESITLMQHVSSSPSASQNANRLPRRQAAKPDGHPASLSSRAAWQSPTNSPSEEEEGLDWEWVLGPRFTLNCNSFCLYGSTAF